MTGDDEESDSSTANTGSEDEEFQAQLDELRAELSELETNIEDRTVHRNEVEKSLKRYVRKRQRRGHARGWGPYLVLLYGTAMTIGAFYYLSGGWAIAAMFVIWLSTLGLYALMIIVGIGLSMLQLPGRMIDRVGSRKD